MIIETDIVVTSSQDQPVDLIEASIYTFNLALLFIYLFSIINWWLS